MIKAGELTQRIELQRSTATRDSTGEPIDSWATYVSVRAQIVGGSGAERLIGPQVAGRAGYAIRMRYRDPVPTITERVKFGSRTFDINSVENIEQANRELLLACTECV